MYQYVKIQLRREWTTSMMFYHSSAEYTDWTKLNPLNLLNPLNPLNILNPLNLLNPILAIRQKQEKPLAVDAKCLLRAIDVAAARKSSNKLGYFQSAPASPLQVFASIARR